MGFYKVIKSKWKGEKTSCKDVEIASQGAMQGMDSCTEAGVYLLVWKSQGCKSQVTGELANVIFILGRSCAALKVLSRTAKMTAAEKGQS